MDMTILIFNVFFKIKKITHQYGKKIRFHFFNSLLLITRLMAIEYFEKQRLFQSDCTWQSKSIILQ